MASFEALERVLYQLAPLALSTLFSNSPKRITQKGTTIADRSTQSDNQSSELVSLHRYRSISPAKISVSSAWLKELNTDKS